MTTDEPTTIDTTATAAELAAELGQHPDDVSGWAHSLIPFFGLDRVYCDRLSARVLLTAWAAGTIRTEGFVTL